MPRALKVFRTAIGFHDAYVAAPSRKAALAAWGTDKDLFARGGAEEVTDPALTAAALARPGEVIRTLRGGAAENIAALGPTPKRARRAGKQAPDRAAPAAPPPPRPSRAALDKAEAALERLRARQAAAREALAERKAALAREEAELVSAQRGELEPVEAKVDEAEAAYQAAMQAWREADGS